MGQAHTPREGESPYPHDFALRRACVRTGRVGIPMRLGLVYLRPSDSYANRTAALISSAIGAAPLALASRVWDRGTKRLLLQCSTQRSPPAPPPLRL